MKYKRNYTLLQDFSTGKRVVSIEIRKIACVKLTPLLRLALNETRK
jgi:hypothetical protein